jgi:hypothetical protein
MRNYLAVLVTALTIGACGGGPSDSTKLVDLTASEAKELCEETIGSRTINCSGTEITIETTQEDCNMAGSGNDVPANCQATVGDFRDCQDAFDAATDAQLCDPEGFTPPACAAIAACSGDA